jgi:hypothetical protein
VATEYAGLDASVETVEHICHEVQDLMAKAHSMLDCVRDVSIPESMSITTAGIINALALKESGEDQLITVVC